MIDDYRDSVQKKIINYHKLYAMFAIQIIGKQQNLFEISTYTETSNNSSLKDLVEGLDSFDILKL